MHAIKHHPSPRKAPFPAMPILAAGLMLSCKGAQESAYEPATAAPALEAAPVPKQRADSGYPIGFTRGCPEWMVRVMDSPRDYCIDRFEAIVGMKRGDSIIINGSSMQPRPNREMSDIVAMVSPILLPQSSIRKPQAESACKNAGKRLCTVHEWKKACAGPLNTTYPYGNTEVTDVRSRGQIISRGKCNTRKPHILSMLHGSDNKGWNREEMKDPLHNKIKGFLSLPGQYPECVSGYGAYDMVGNLHEWVSDIVDGQILASMPNTGTKIPGVGGRLGNSIFMGGFYSTGNDNGPGCHYMTIAHGGEQDDYSVGFRCCKTLEY